MAQVVGDADGIRSNRVRRDHWVGAPNLLAGLPQLALDRERLASRSGIECGDTHHFKPALKGNAFRAWFTRTGDAGKDFYCGQRRDYKRSARRGGNPRADVLVARFFLKQRFDDAGVEQEPHRLK